MSQALHRIRGVTTRILGGNPDQRARAKAAQRQALADLGPPEDSLTVLTGPQAPITRAQCNPIVVQGYDMYVRYQDIDIPTFRAHLIDLSARNVAKGLSANIIVSFKIGTDLSTIDSVRAGFLARTWAVYDGIKDLPFVYFMAYWWPYHGTVQHMYDQADLFVRTARAHVGPIIPPRFGFQADSEQAGVTATDVDAFSSRVEAETGHRCIFEYSRTSGKRPDRRWPARYHCNPPWGNFYDSMVFCFNAFGYVPTIFQWAGGAQGPFVPGVNSGRTRTDANLYGHEADFLTAFAAPLPPPPPVVVPPTDPEENMHILKAQEDFTNNAAPQWLSNGITKRWLDNGHQVATLGGGMVLQPMAFADIDLIPNEGHVPPGWRDHRTNPLP